MQLENKKLILVRGKIFISTTRSIIECRVFSVKQQGKYVEQTLSTLTTLLCKIQPNQTHLLDLRERKESFMNLI